MRSSPALLAGRAAGPTGEPHPSLPAATAVSHPGQPHDRTRGLFREVSGSAFDARGCHGGSPPSSCSHPKEEHVHQTPQTLEGSDRRRPPARPRAPGWGCTERGNNRKQFCFALVSRNRKLYGSLDINSLRIRRAKDLEVGPHPAAPEGEGLPGLVPRTSLSRPNERAEVRERAARAPADAAQS